MNAEKRICRSFVLLLGLIPSLGLAQAKQQSTEDWAWDRIRAGRIANFNDLCGKKLDPKEDDVDWNEKCRQLRASFLEDLLVDSKRLDQIRHHQVQLRGARITGKIDLGGLKISTAVSIVDSRISDLDLRDSHLESWFCVDGSV